MSKFVDFDALQYDWIIFGRPFKCIGAAGKAEHVPKDSRPELEVASPKPETRVLHLALGDVSA